MFGIFTFNLSFSWFVLNINWDFDITLNISTFSVNVFLSSALYFCYNYMSYLTNSK